MDRPRTDGSAGGAGPAVTSCRLCGAPPPYRPLFSSAGYHLVRCPRCTLTFLDPQPDEEVLAGSYYHDPAFTDALAGPLRAVTLGQAARNAAMLARVAPTTPGRLLDVGCSSGAWLELATRAGWQATGIELGAATSAAARACGLDVRTGTLAEVAPTLTAGSFDLITFWDVIEHVRDPNVELAAARRLLRAGGRVAVACPNIGGLIPRLTLRCCGRPLGVWEHPEPPVHLFDFSVPTLTALLSRHGLSPVGHATTRIPLAHLRSVTLDPDRIGRGRRASAAAALITALHAVLGPAAAAVGLGNAMLVVAEA